jgi:hypothetical protein
LGFGFTWTVRRITCVFTLGFGSCVNAACVWVAVPVLELRAYPPSAPSPATLARAAIFILRLFTWTPSSGVAEVREISLRRDKEWTAKVRVKGRQNLEPSAESRDRSPLQWMRGQRDEERPHPVRRGRERDL